MPNYSQEVSDRVSNDRKTLEGSVANLKNLFLVGLASVVISGCSGQRANAVWGSLGYDAASTAVSGAVVYGLNEMMSPPDYGKGQRQRDYPMLFTGNENFKNIGKQIFYSGEKIYIRGNLNGVVPNGTIVANKNIHLLSGQSDFVIKKSRVKKGEIIYGSFDATHLARNIGQGEYENTWYANIDGEWKELGRVNYAVFDRIETSKREKASINNN